MQKFKLYQAPYLAFFSKDFYADVARNWKGRSILLLFIVTALASLPVSVNTYVAINMFLEKADANVVGEMPPISIKNGKLTTPSDEMYVIKTDIDSKEEKIIIDTTGEHTSLEGSGASVLVTETDVHIKESETETSIHSFDNIDSLSFDKNDVQGWMDMFRQWFLVLLVPLLIAFFFVMRLVQMLFHSLFGLIMKSILQSAIQYEQLLALCAVSLVPVIIIVFLLDIAPVDLDLPWFVYFLIAMG
ncbi:MAG: DUF1189 domain-containing protein [Spirochaetota bacterium]